MQTDEYMASEERQAAIPTKIAAAIAAVMGEVPKLSKGEKNSHGNYNFASIDDFLEAVRPLCAKHGLVIIQDEVHQEILRSEPKGERDKSVSWLLIRFQFTLGHSSGETWAHRPTRTIMVNAAMGSQAFGAAQSYCLKQFQRSLFQIATGETGEGADIDYHAKGDLASAPTQQKSAYRARKDGDWDAAMEFRSITNLDALNEWYQANRKKIESMPASWLDHFYPLYEDHRASLKEDVTMAG